MNWTGLRVQLQESIGAWQHLLTAQTVSQSLQPCFVDNPHEECGQEVRLPITMVKQQLVESPATASGTAAGLGRVRRQLRSIVQSRRERDMFATKPAELLPPWLVITILLVVITVAGTIALVVASRDGGHKK